MTEIVECGDLVQDHDDVTPQVEAERRWNRYVALADAVTGSEGPTGVAAIVTSLKAVEDYGAHQAAHMALARFPADDLGTGVAVAADGLLAIPRDNSGNVLLIVVSAGSVAIDRFDDAVGSKPMAVQIAIRQLVEFHESEEWLSEDGRRDVLLVPRNRYMFEGRR